MSQAQASRAAADSNPDRATRLKLYRTMLEVRLVEKRAYDLFMQNLIKGTSHLEPSRARTGGDRCWVRRRHAQRRLQLLHLSRSRPHARAWRVDGRGARRAHGARVVIGGR